MLVPISFPPALLELYNLLLRFWQEHGTITLISFSTGGLLMFLTYSILGYRRMRTIRRIINMAVDADIDELVYGSHVNRLRIHRSPDSARYHVQNLQAPAVRGSHAAHNDTLKRIGESIVYYFPENSSDLPEGLQIPERAVWIFGDPPTIQLPLQVTPVSVDAIGSWYPAVIKCSTGLTQVRPTMVRQYWKHGYRNLFIGDFVMKGDVLGAVTVPGLTKRQVIVRAPCDGFILQFGAYAYTPVALHACVMLIGDPLTIEHFDYPHDLAGYFTCRPEKNGNLVGTTLEPDELIGNASLLFGTIQEPIHAPARMRIVRQYIKDGDAVQYGQKLFDYIPLDKPLT